MPEQSDTRAQLRAPGRTVEARLSHWQSLTWEELVTLMTSPTEGSDTNRPAADSLAAPAVTARLR